MRPALLLATLAACTQTDGTTDFNVAAPVMGTAPQSSRVAVLWTVNSAQPYQYKFGDGTASMLEYVVTLDGTPPPAAINTSGLAIGEVILFSADATIPDGVFAGGVTQVGVTMDYALIWKDPLGAGLGTWDTAFGANYSCAKCQRSTGGGLDGYVLTGCAQMTLIIGGAATCSWY
jgi:hypothetical protein